MPKRVEDLNEAVVFDDFFKIVRATLRHEKYDGSMSDTMVRLNLERGDSVAAVIHDPQADTIVLTEQFRYPTYHKGPGWLLELPAGTVNPGEDPADTMRRELMEEIGYTVDELTPISLFYLSPGGTSERIHLYYARVTSSHRTAEGGGLGEEHEDIRRITVPVSEALEKMASGVICDAKTIIGLQWLQLQRSK